MKNIALIGASGFVGTAILNEALGRGYKVTAIVRHPNRIDVKNDNLTIKAVDVMDTDKLQVALKGCNVVISAYNPGWQNPAIVEDTKNAYNSIIEAVKQAGINRFLMVGGAGSLFVAPKIRLLDTDDIPSKILPAVKALANVMYGLQQNNSNLDWTVLSPAANIKPGERTGKFRLGKDDLLVDANGVSQISVEDYAVAMLDELENHAHPLQRFTLAY